MDTDEEDSGVPDYRRRVKNIQTVSDNEEDETCEFTAIDGFSL
jgi:hypothetical protein